MTLQSSPTKAIIEFSPTARTTKELQLKKAIYSF
jgi:hypothetical protein